MNFTIVGYYPNNDYSSNGFFNIYVMDIVKLVSYFCLAIVTWSSL